MCTKPLLTRKTYQTAIWNRSRKNPIPITFSEVEYQTRQVLSRNCFVEAYRIMWRFTWLQKLIQFFRWTSLKVWKSSSFHQFMRVARSLIVALDHIESVGLFKMSIIIGNSPVAGKADTFTKNPFLQFMSRWMSWVLEKKEMENKRVGDDEIGELKNRRSQKVIIIKLNWNVFYYRPRAYFLEEYA